MTRTVKFKVCAMQSGFAVLFLLTFCAMLAMLSAAAFGIPAGIMLSIAGVAVKLFNAAVKAGFVISRLFLRVKRRCDICRGWKPY